MTTHNHHAALSAVRRAGELLAIHMQDVRPIATAFTNYVFIVDDLMVARVTPPGITTGERASAQMTLTRADFMREVVAPAVHDSPIAIEDLLVGFWAYRRPHREATWHDVGNALRTLHDVTRFKAIALPTRPVIPDHARDRIAAYAELETADQSLVRQMTEEWAELSSMNPELQTELGIGAIHAEGHQDNVVVTKEGPLLVDVDEMSLGAREIDLCAPVVRFPTIEQGLRSRPYQQLSDAYHYDISNWKGLGAAYRGRRLGHLAYLLLRLRHGDAAIESSVIQRLYEYGLDSESAERIVTASFREAIATIHG